MGLKILGDSKMATAETKRATEVMTGADILVKSLVDHGVDVVFALSLIHISEPTRPY